VKMVAKCDLSFKFSIEFLNCINLKMNLKMRSIINVYKM
jgi:hypothetical protein